MPFNGTQITAFSRTTPNDGLLFQAEFQRIYANLNFINAALPPISTVVYIIPGSSSGTAWNARISLFPGYDATADVNLAESSARFSALVQNLIGSSWRICDNSAFMDSESLFFSSTRQFLPEIRDRFLQGSSLGRPVNQSVGQFRDRILTGTTGGISRAIIGTDIQSTIDQLLPQHDHGLNVSTALGATGIGVNLSGGNFVNSFDYINMRGGQTIENRPLFQTGIPIIRIK